MCIVVDLNSLPNVFCPDSKKHADFKPVHDWIIHGKGYAVYGGTKYKVELGKSYRYLKLFRQLKETRRAIEVRQDAVDARESELLSTTKGKGCDDQHIIAILCVSGCLLLCSEDKRSFKFVKNRCYYGKGRPKPRIYQSPKHKFLLCDENIVHLRNICL